MTVTMYIKPDQLRSLKEKGKGYALTYRDGDSCFVIQVELDKVHLNTHDKGMPRDSYYISI